MCPSHLVEKYKDHEVMISKQNMIKKGKYATKTQVILREWKARIFLGKSWKVKCCFILNVQIKKLKEKKVFKIIFEN